MTKEKEFSQQNNMFSINRFPKIILLQIENFL